MQKLIFIAALLFCGPALSDLVGCEVNSATTADDLSVSVPAGTANGHAMVAFYSKADDASAMTLTNWTQHGNVWNSSTSATFGAFWTRVASSEPSSYTFTNNGLAGNATGIICVFSEIHADILDVTYVQGSHWIKEFNETSPTAQPITTATNGATVLVWSSNAQNNVTDMVCPASGGTWTEIIALDLGFARHVNVCSDVQATAGTVTPGASEHTGIASTDETQFFTVALKPAATGGKHYYRRRQECTGQCGGKMYVPCSPNYPGCD